MRRHAARPRGKGRNPISKRWIYWKRRYSHPTRRDWLLLVCFVWIVAAALVSLIDFRAGGLVLAAAPVALAALRCLPEPWGAIWTNRGRGVDIVTMLVLGCGLALLSLSVPNN